MSTTPRRGSPASDTRDRVIAMEVNLGHVLTKLDELTKQMAAFQEMHQQAKGGWRLARLIQAPIGGVAGYLAANTAALSSWLTLPPH